MTKKWIGQPSPKSRHVGSGWFGELNKSWVDAGYNYAVMAREVDTEWGKVTHACIRNKENTDIAWSEKQRIKNELFGEESTAIEVFPANHDLVDAVNMYHIWILPKGMTLPFTIKQKE